MIPKLKNLSEINKAATQSDIVKINKVLSVPSEQYLKAISQGEKTPKYYRTARQHLHTMTQAPPTHIPRVPQPMGTQGHSQPISYNLVNKVNT